MKLKKREFQLFKRVCMALPFCLFTFLPLSAQSTFTQRLQQRNTGEGTVTVTHDKAIDDLVNGTGTVPNRQAIPQSQADKTVTHQQTDKITGRSIVTEPQDTVAADSPVIDNHKKVMRGGYKVNGYRVQVFAGGNSRNDRLKAERIGDEIKALYPGVPVYVHFYSPRWICRMGNYRNYEEASEVLRSVKKLGYRSAVIVKGKITVPYL